MQTITEVGHKMHYQLAAAEIIDTLVKIIDSNSGESIPFSYRGVINDVLALLRQPPGRQAVIEIVNETASISQAREKAIKDRMARTKVEGPYILQLAERIIEDVESVQAEEKAKLISWLEEEVAARKKAFEKSGELPELSLLQTAEFLLEWHKEMTT